MHWIWHKYWMKKREESEEKHENNRHSNIWYFEKLLCNIPKIVPESEVVIILRKRNLIAKSNFLAARFIKCRIDHYIENWKSKISDKFIVATFNLTLKDNR